MVDSKTYQHVVFVAWLPLCGQVETISRTFEGNYLSNRLVWGVLWAGDEGRAVIVMISREWERSS